MRTVHVSVFRRDERSNSSGSLRGGRRSSFPISILWDECTDERMQASYHSGSMSAAFPVSRSKLKSRLVFFLFSFSFCSFLAVAD